MVDLRYTSIVRSSTLFSSPGGTTRRIFVCSHVCRSMILAENEHDMQRNLNLLNDYCNCIIKQTEG